MRRTGFSLPSLIIPLLIIICSPAVAQTSQVAAQQKDSPDDQALKTRTDLVNVGVLARQKKTGRIVTNMTKDDFTIFEDGVRQTVSYFSQERLPLSIILLVDRAGCINAFNDRWSPCQDNLCMQAITVETVLARVCEVYEARREKAGAALTPG